jgi:hypothetical protein
LCIYWQFYNSKLLLNFECDTCNKIKNISFFYIASLSRFENYFCCQDCWEALFLRLNVSIVFPDLRSEKTTYRGAITILNNANCYWGQFQLKRKKISNLRLLFLIDVIEARILKKQVKKMTSEIQLLLERCAIKN